jgi:hypothetical protein
MSTGFPVLFHTDRYYSETNVVGAPQASEQAETQILQNKQLMQQHKYNFFRSLVFNLDASRYVEKRKLYFSNCMSSSSFFSFRSTVSLL